MWDPAPPCLGLATGDASIVPDDWFVKVADSLDGGLNWFRVEVPLSFGTFEVELGGVRLDREWMSYAESSERTAVYYVPASREASITIWSNRGNDDEGLAVTIDGVEKSWF